MSCGKDVFSGGAYKDQTCGEDLFKEVLSRISHAGPDVFSGGACKDQTCRGGCV